MKKISNENISEEHEESVMSEAAGEEGSSGIGDGAAKILRSALKSASEGIQIGKTADLSSDRDVSSIFNDIHELVVAPLLLSSPGRQLERKIKGAAGLTKDNTSVNLDAKTRFQREIISLSTQIYGSNFAPLIGVLRKIPALKGQLEPLNDISNIEAMAIDFKGRDLSITYLSQKSPYKIIINRIIPILREKFDAVASFNISLGPGEKIDYEGISHNLHRGIASKEELSELGRFYKAISEWRGVLEVFSDSSLSLSGMENGGESQNTEDNEGDEDSKESGIEDGGVIGDNIYIRTVRPGQYVHRDPTGEGGLYINDHALRSEDTPVVKLYIEGAGADSINSLSLSGEEYLEYFIDRNIISFPNSADLSFVQILEQIINNVTRESVSGGAEITVYFRPGGVRAIKGRATERIEIMRVSSHRRNISVFADDTSQIEALKKVSSTESTPYYEAISPSGEHVFFTPADLVISGGSLKDSKGKKFKPKKIKGKSLAQRVTSKGFGKVRRKA